VDPKAQRNFTDPESRIMRKSGKEYVQAYNAQAAVDSTAQVIVAQSLSKRHHEASATGRRRTQGTRVAAMRTKLARAGRRSRYRLRKSVVEPIFGQIKHPRGFRQFMLRGLEKAQGEWSLICTVHNLLKLAKATKNP
jgi:hypothetical protein